KAREPRRPRDAESVDETGIDAAPQQAARDLYHRLNDRGIVDLIDVVLLLEHLLDALLWRRLALRHERFGLETCPCECDTGDRDEIRDTDEHVLGVRRERSTALRDLGGLANDRIEPVLELSHRAEESSKLWNVEPAATKRENAERNERPSHD